jgi:hypothetical protein
MFVNDKPAVLFAAILTFKSYKHFCLKPVYN